MFEKYIDEKSKNPNFAKKLYLISWVSILFSLNRNIGTFFISFFGLNIAADIISIRFENAKYKKIKNDFDKLINEISNIGYRRENPHFSPLRDKAIKFITLKEEYENFISERANLAWHQFIPKLIFSLLFTIIFSLDPTKKAEYLQANYSNSEVILRSIFELFIVSLIIFSPFIISEAVNLSNNKNEENLKKLHTDISENSHKLEYQISNLNYQ